MAKKKKEQIARRRRMVRSSEPMGADWNALLDPANGGPGEVPGRAECIAELKAAQEEEDRKYNAHG